jgi:AAA domain
MNTPAQLDLADDTNPLIGQRVQFGDHGCRQCQSKVATIGQSHKHAGALLCADCGNRVGWLSHETASSLTVVISKFSAPEPDKPIIIRRRAPSTDTAPAIEDNTPPEPKPAPAQNAGPTITPIKLTFFDELTQPIPKPWLIKNVMAGGETSSWIAPPGKGESALLTDIAVHLAGEKPWRGYRTKARAGTVYFALERADLVKRRLIAHRLRDQLPNLPIAVAGEVIDLMDKKCVTTIITAIQQAEQHFGCEIGLAIFDTYPKGIAAGGGDESSAKDQNAALANMRRVLDKLNIHVAGIGHTGKDESKGERGLNAPGRCGRVGTDQRRYSQSGYCQKGQ